MGKNKEARPVFVAVGVKLSEATVFPARGSHSRPGPRPSLSLSPSDSCCVLALQGPMAPCKLVTQVL